jgi:mitochondrial import receptor subunit TOM70
MNSYNAAVEKGCRDMAKALNMKATFTFLKGNATEALDDFTRAISADPQYVQSYVKRASIYMEQGNPAETFAQFEKAIELDSKNPDIYYHRGQGKLKQWPRHELFW